MEKSVVVIIGKDKYFCRNVICCAKFSNVKFVDTPDKNKGLQLIEQAEPQLAIITSTPSSLDEDIEYISLIKRTNIQLPVLFISPKSSEDIIIDAFKAGINNFYKPPFVYSDIASDIKKLLSKKKAPSQRDKPEKRDKPSHFIGHTATMRKIRQYIERVSPLDTTVFITGETGTGKGLAALLVHRLSKRSAKPFISVNCAALPDDLVESELFGYEKGAFTGAVSDRMGKFEMASGGTLFLDEIGDMGAYTQAKVLKIIEEHENTRLGSRKTVRLDLRLIAATNIDPEELLAARRFRKDLYYRINVARIHLPPLRERKEDIPRLISHSLQSLNQKYGRNIHSVSDEATNLLLKYDWPGNVRELKNVVEAAFILAQNDIISKNDFPPTLTQNDTVAGPCDTERDNILSVLESTNWNKTLAASKMKCSRMTLYRKMAKHNLALS